MELLRGEQSRVFQFTPLREGRHARSLQSGANLVISIHAPPRGATRLAEDFGIRVDISIHAPPRGATGKRGEETSILKFQFTPLREGRRGKFPITYERYISIHAPPRGATWM